MGGETELRIRGLPLSKRDDKAHALFSARAVRGPQSLCKGDEERTAKSVCIEAAEVEAAEGRGAKAKLKTFLREREIKTAEATALFPRARWPCPSRILPTTHPGAWR